MAQLNQTAQTFKSLHKPGSPVVLANVYDAVTAEAVSSLPACRALATASKAIALASAMEDDDLDLATNMVAVRTISLVARKHGLPLTVDLQDGYGDSLEEAIRQVIDAGVVGVNIEDMDKDAQKLMPPEEAAERVARTMRVARQKGVPDFVVNARCDALLQGHDLDEVVRRGLLYLKAGATCIFVWGAAARGGISRDEVVQLTHAFGGRLSVSMKLPEGEGLTVAELADIGVCRISVGPKLQVLAMKAYAHEAGKFLK